MSRLERARRDTRFGAAAAAATFGSLLMVAPIIWMVLTSLKTEEQAVSFPPALLFRPTLAHYRAALDDAFAGFALNSLLAAGLSTLIVIALAVPAAYALSVRPVAQWRDALFFFISTKMMPIAAGIVPLYLIARTLGLLNSLAVLVLLYVGMNLPLAIWMIRSFMIELPRELLEAARVDGAGPMREIGSIILPLIRPGLASTTLLCFLFAWNEYFLAVNFTSTTGTLTVFLQRFLSFGRLYTAQVAAVATLVNIPVVAAGWLAQRNLVRGLTFGAVK